MHLVLLVGAALAPAAAVRTESRSGCFDALNFTELRCLLSAEMFGLNDAPRGVSGVGHFCAEKEGEKNLTLSNKNVLTISALQKHGKGFVCFPVCNKKTFKNLKTCDKMEYSPAAHATSMALNLDILLEKQQCSDPAVPLHFETSCLPLTSSKTSEAQLLRARKSSFSLT